MLEIPVEPSAFFASITPADATEILSKNPKPNSPYRADLWLGEFEKREINRYRTAMDNHKFPQYAAALRFDGAGGLIGGRAVLEALAGAQVASVAVTVITGLDPRAGSFFQ
jgi:hypothetical protein